MQLTYRGIPYELNTSNVPTTVGKIVGRYRGAILRTQECTMNPTPRPFTNLKYRGAYYQPVGGRPTSTALISAF